MCYHTVTYPPWQEEFQNMLKEEWKGLVEVRVLTLEEARRS